MAIETVVRVTDLINPNFYPVWRTKKPNVVLSGGRSSMKSSVISLKLVKDFLEDDQGNVICLRKVGKYLSPAFMNRLNGRFTSLVLKMSFSLGNRL